MNKEFEDKVFPAEWAEIDQSRRHRLEANPYQPNDPNNPYPDTDRLKLAGLAFSGGGIRSATFNLGVIQALAKLGLLKHFDYLSTVSGGGYIGSWLSAWIKREKGGINGVEEVLARAEGGDEEPEQVRFLRDYSNYLTPEASFLSADTWTSVATYVRNIFLNLLLLVFAFAAVLLLPRCLVGGATQLGRLSSWNHAVGLAGVGLLLFAMFWIGTNLTLVGSRVEQGEYPPYADTAGVQRRIVLPVLLSALMTTWWLGLHGFSTGWPWWEWILVLGILYVILGVVGTGFGRIWAGSKGGSNAAEPDSLGETPKFSKKKSWFLRKLAFKNLFWAFWAGAIGGLLLYAIAGWIGTWRLQSGEPNDLLILTFGPPLLLLLAATVVTLHIGFTGRLLKSEIQEWWLRLSAWLMIYTLGWVALFVAALYAPFLFDKLGRLNSTLQTSGFFGWVVTTAMGVIAGKNPKSGETGSASWLDWIAKIAAYVFVGGFVGLISVGLHRLLLLLFREGAGTAGDWMAYFAQVVDTSGIGTLVIFLICTGIALVLAFRIDINLFSLHFYYRNRLIRCYLGASRGAAADPGGKRQPNPFTGFDPEDNLAMQDLATRVGPYHIVNTALNLVKGDNLAWQQRKATSFVFTPKYCGYAPWTEVVGYRDTREYAQADYTFTEAKIGPSLGTALAISGAAFTPNMGYHSSPAVAFLLTVFSVRLGVWFGNPGHDGPEFPALGGRPAWQRQAPTFSLPYLLFELFGLANEKRAFVSLSDGGHFENLGIYELIRRRCKYIVAIDAGQDGSYGFEDLGGAIRKCRIDFNTDIIIEVAELCPRRVPESERRKDEEKRSDAHYAVGTIVYPDQSQGILIYLKPTLTGDESTDIRNYAGENPDFPHQSTNDQWFDESQFESYRKLGYHIAGTAFPKPVAGALDPERYFETVREMANKKS